MLGLVIAGVGSPGQAQELKTIPEPLGQSLQASLISAPPEARLTSPFVAFRKRFFVSETGRAAALHLFADVRYLVWINGSYVLSGPARFEPAGPEYDSVDVHSRLHRGDNEIVVLVLSQVSNGKMRAHAAGLTARIEVDHRTVTQTDETWKWSDRTRYRQPTVNWGNLMDRIDARKEDGDWTQLAYDDRDWPTAVRIDGAKWGPLTARRIPLLRETPLAPIFPGGRTLPATLLAGQALAFRLDHLVQACTRLEIEADEGSELSLGYAGIHYVAKAGRQTYISSDSHGFAEGALRVESGRVTIRRFELMERLYPFDLVGRFHSSDERLNRLWSLCARSCQVLSEDAYVDCADRERTEWMDCDPPAFDLTRTAFAGPAEGGGPDYGDARLLGAMLRRTALTIQPDGWVKAHTCSDRFDLHAKMEDRACDWVEGARRYYESTGDAALIREIWPVIVRQMDYFLARRSPRGLVLGREWVVWGNPVGYVTCEGTGLNAFVCRALLDAAYLGKVIGEPATAGRLGQAGDKLREAINTVLWNEPKQNYYSGFCTADELALPGNSKALKLGVKNDLIEPSMFSALWALDQGVVPESRIKSVRRGLIANRQQAGRVMTYYYLFGQLYRADCPEFDEEILQTMRTKWREMIDWPWHTTWEEFTGASKAHIYGVFPGYFLSAYVLGVRPDGPVWNHRLIVEPRLGKLTQAEGVVVTEHGPVAVSWKAGPGRLAFQLEIPPGTVATVRIPIRGRGRLVIDGQTVQAKRDGNHEELELAAGRHEGLLTSAELVRVGGSPP